MQLKCFDPFEVVKGYRSKFDAIASESDCSAIDLGVDFRNGKPPSRVTIMSNTISNFDRR